MTLRYRLLGPLEVLRDGTPLDLGAPKQRSVLACLLLERGRVVPVERLVDVVWGEDVPTSAVPSLQVYVSNLRRLLRDPGSDTAPLTRRAPGYLLQAGHGELDLDDFTAAADRARSLAEEGDWAAAADVCDTATRLCRGPLLGDLGEPPWVTAAARTVAERLVEVRRTAVTALLGTGRVDEAVSAALALADEEPYRDDVRRLAMLALHRSGRTAEALEGFRRHVELLDDELGIEPSTELRELQVALLRQEDWATRWPLDDTVAPRRAPRRSEAAVPEAEPRPGDGLVGRDAELAVAGELVDAVVAGSSRWLVLTGPAGIGKTRLAETVAASVRARGGRVLHGRCLEEQGAPAWWPLRQVVRDLDADPDVVLSPPAGAQADSARFAVYERVRDLVADASTSCPVAVVVDDLQWADATTLSCLSYLSSATRDGRVLAVVTVRDGEGGAQVRRTTAALLRSEGARQIDVPALEEAEVATLAAQVAGESLDRDEARMLAERTGGNALFVCEYARLPREQRSDGAVPLAVRGLLARRIETLDDEVVRMLRAAAVIGDSFDLGLLAAVTGTGHDDLVDGLDEAAEEHIIESRPDRTGYAFAHALLREEVLAGLSDVRRQRLHARVAGALATTGGERLTQRAQHLLAARALADPRELLEACRAAALQAEERWSSETAVQWWGSARDAFDLLPGQDRDGQERDDLTVARIEALARSGRGQTVLDTVDEELLEAARLGRTSTVGRLAATLLRATGTWPWVAVGQDSGALQARLDGLATTVADDPAARIRVDAARAVGHCYHFDRSVPEGLSAAALDRAERLGDPDVLADALLGRVLAFVGVADHAAESERLLDRLVALPRERGAVDAVLAHSARTMSRVLLGDVTGAEEQLRRAVAGTELYRLPLMRVQLRWMEVGLVQWRHGPEAALPEQAEAVATHRRTELYEGAGGGFGSMVLLALHWDLGDLSELSGLPAYTGFEATVWAAALAAATGKHERAAELVAQRLSEPPRTVWATLCHLTVLAHVVADLGLVEHARPMVDLLARHTGRLAGMGQGPILGPVDLALARLHRLAGDETRAVELLVAARDLAARHGGRHWVERCDALLR